MRSAILLAFTVLFAVPVYPVPLGSFGTRRIVGLGAVLVVLVWGQAAQKQ